MIRSRYQKYNGFRYWIFLQYLKLIDNHWIKKDKYHSDIYKYSTTLSLIRYFNGYLGHNVDQNQGNLGFGLIHLAIISNLKPESLLCIGSGQGFIPAICALGCKENQKGHVDFVDAGYGPQDKNNWGGINFWKENDPDKHFSILGLNKYITTHIMTTRNFAKKFPKKLFEYIYVDGDHSYEGVKYDFETFWPRLTTGGFMVFHDIEMKGLNHGIEFGVKKLWKEISKNKSINLSSFDNGIGLIQKK